MKGIAITEAMIIAAPAATYSQKLRGRMDQALRKPVAAIRATAMA